MHACRLDIDPPPSRAAVDIAPLETSDALTLQRLQHFGAAEIDEGLAQLLRTLKALTRARHVSCTLVDVDPQQIRRPLVSAGLGATESPLAPVENIVAWDYEIRPGRHLEFQFHTSQPAQSLNTAGVTVLLGALHRWLIWLDLSHGPVDETGVMPRPHRKVLLLMLKGLTEKQIAASLGLSVNTAHRYITLLYRRYGVRNRASLTSLWL